MGRRGGEGGGRVPERGPEALKARAPFRPALIARKSALVFLNNAVGAVLGLLAIKTTSYYLGVEIVGEWNAAIGFLGLLYFVTDLGFGPAHTKRVSEGMDPGDCLTTFAAFKAVTTGLFVGVSLAVVAFRVLVLGKPLEDATPVTILVALAYMALKSLSAVPGATFDAKRETARSQTMQFVETAVRVGLAVPLALLIAAALDRVGPFVDSGLAASSFAAWARANPAAALGLAWLSSAAVATLLGLAYLPRSTSWGRFRWDILRSYWVYALPIFLVTAVNTVSTYIDKATLAYFWSDVEVGRFSQPKLITGFLETLPMAVTLLLFPTVSALHAERRYDRIEETTIRAERYTSMVVFPVVTVLVVYPDTVIRVLLSAEWLGAEWTLRWLAVYALLIAITRPGVAVLLGMDKPGQAARIGVAMTASNILFTLVLVPPALRIVPVPLAGLADVGAALATALSGLVGFLMFRRAAPPSVRRASLRFLALHTLAALLMAALLVALAFLVDGPLRWFHLVGFSALASAAYLGALVAIGEFTRGDLRFFLEALHVGDLGRYVRDELRR